jgi:hypothetical protein
VARLLRDLRLAGAQDQAAALLARDPAARVSLDDPGGVARLLGALREAGAQDQAAALLARDPAARVSFDNPGGVAWLLHELLLRSELRLAGAQDQAAALADRAVGIFLRGAGGVMQLLYQLRRAGAQDQAAAVADRLPAAGMFWLFLRQPGRADQFRFGRDADGSPSAPWGWEDLYLWPASLRPLVKSNRFRTWASYTQTECSSR